MLYLAMQNPHFSRFTACPLTLSTVTHVSCVCVLEYYPNCEVMFMGMANIHAIRNSFQALRTVCSQIPDPGK